MLPEIVRAAAEPMANIETLTVLSTDGASDLVKNVTRTVTEAIDHGEGPDRHRHPGAREPGHRQRRVHRRVAGRRRAAAERAGRVRRPRRAVADPRPSGTTGGSASGGPAQAGGGTSAAPAEHRVDRSAGVRGTAATHDARRSRPRRGSPVRRPIDAALADADRAVRARPARRATPRTDTAAGPPRPASAEIDRIDDRRRRGQPARHGPARRARHRALRDVRLAELDQSGPRPLRTMWRIAREQLDERYGQLTIGELIDRYGSGRQTPA